MFEGTSECPLVQNTASIFRARLDLSGLYPAEFSVSQTMFLAELSNLFTWFSAL